MILTRLLLFLLSWSCSAEISHEARLELISNKVESLEKTVSSLQRSILKLEVSRILMKLSRNIQAYKMLGGQLN